MRSTTCARCGAQASGRVARNDGRVEPLCADHLSDELVTLAREHARDIQRVVERAADSNAAPAATVESRSHLTVAEVAARLAISKATVYRLIERGRLRRVKVGSAVRVPADSLADYLREGR